MLSTLRNTPLAPKHTLAVHLGCFCAMLVARSKAMREAKTVETKENHKDSLERLLMAASLGTTALPILIAL